MSFQDAHATHLPARAQLLDGNNTTFLLITIKTTLPY
jgi:hypothetical protein